MTTDSQILIARDPNTSCEALDELSLHPDEMVRGAVASNEKASQYTLLGLVGDPSSYVRDKLRTNKSEFCLASLEVAACKHTTLRLAGLDDARFILDLRLDPERNKHVSEVEDSLPKQIQWMIAYKQRELGRQEFYFVIQSSKGEPYGAVRIYDFNAVSFCWGSWMIRRGAPAHTAIESALSVYEFAFYTLRFQRAHFDVRKNNERVVKFHERFGATITRSDAENYYFRLEREEYQYTRERYKRFF